MRTTQYYSKGIQVTQPTKNTSSKVIFTQTLFTPQSFKSNYIFSKIILYNSCYSQILEIINYQHRINIQYTCIRRGFNTGIIHPRFSPIFIGFSASLFLGVLFFIFCHLDFVLCFSCFKLVINVPTKDCPIVNFGINNY